MNLFDAIVAGAGIWGCTVARRLAEAGKKVLVLEKRAAVGGNCRCEIDSETGIEVHTYGSHIFHTHVPEVWAFVNRFTSFNGYQHKVLAKTKKIGVENRWTEDGFHLYHLPLGLTLINKFFGVELKPCEVESFMREESHSRAIFDAFFRGYTSKQWGRSPEQIDPSIIKRVPVRGNYDTNYFNDYWQGIPSEGYNAMFERMLKHENIMVQCGCELVIEKIGVEHRCTADGLHSDTEVRYLVKVKGEGEHWIDQFLSDAARTPRLRGGESGALIERALPVYYSGPIDALFGYKLGHLPWRTLKFETERLNVSDFQGTSVVNYTDADVPYTRIHEFKHYHPEKVEVVGDRGERKLISRWGFDAPKTIIIREYPSQWQPGDEPYYPIDNEESRVLLVKYREEVEKFNGAFRRNAPTGEVVDNHHSSTSTPNLNLIVGGRLGEYKYYDMDKAIESALKLKID